MYQVNGNHANGSGTYHQNQYNLQPQYQQQQTAAYAPPMQLTSEHYVNVVPMNQPHMVMMTSAGNQLRAH
jgi:hypothetical protein